ncbi:916_t:CDS:2, partial [Diversispora eburnea]
NQHVDSIKIIPRNSKKQYTKANNTMKNINDIMDMSGTANQLLVTDESNNLKDKGKQKDTTIVQEDFNSGLELFTNPLEDIQETSKTPSLSLTQ